MKKKVLLYTTSLIAGCSAMILSGCSMFGGSGTGNETAVETAATSGNTEAEKISSLEFDHEIPVERSEFLSIDSYKDGYYVIKGHNGDTFQQLLVVPEGKGMPEGLDKNIIVVKQPVDTSKIDSPSMMTLVSDINEALSDKISLVALDKDHIYTDKIKANVESGLTKYAGLAEEPDFNIIKDNIPQVFLSKSGLAKKTDEEYRKLGISPFTTYLHQELDPLGRIEWVKALGVIYGDTEGAEKFYEAQKSVMEGIDKSKAEGRTFAMICLKKKDNKAFVRRTGDTIAKIGEAAGGTNALSDVHKTTWEEMSIDDFVQRFKDTDFLIYLDKHGDSVTSMEELNGISDKFSELNAVNEGNVWRTRTDYMQMNKVGDMAKDLNGIFSGDEEAVKSVTEFVKVE